MPIFRNIFNCRCDNDDDDDDDNKNRSFALFNEVEEIKIELRDIQSKIRTLDREQIGFKADISRLSDKLDTKFNNLLTKIDLILISLNNRN